MFTVTYKGFDVACETAQDAIEFVDAADKPKIQATTRPTTRPTTRKPRKPKTKRATPDRAEKDKRNAKARAAYLAKHPGKTTTTTSRLEALPSKPTHIGRKPEGGKRARTSQAVMDTLKRSPSPLTLDEIDTDLEKSGWPYKGQDRKGAIRATLARLKANGTVTTFLRGEGSAGGAMQMFRLERTNGDVTTPVEQALTPGREERAEIEDSEQQMAADEARAEAEEEAREF